MMKLQSTLSCLLIFALCFSACKKDEEGPSSYCDENLVPIIMMHGSLGSGDTYSNHFMRFADNKYCIDRLFAFDWNSLDQNSDHTISLDAFIDEVLAKTGASKVNLAGHSAGGGLGTNYIASSPERAAKISHYAHIGSFVLDSTLADVPMLNLWSNGDKIVPGANIPGAQNVELNNQDHYQVATSEESFEAIYSFFNSGSLPETTSIKAQNVVWISGKVLSFAENMPLDGAQIEIYELDAETGFRLNNTPYTTITTKTDGLWGPLVVNSDIPYEFFVQTNNPSDRPVHYYREPFKHTNQLVYLRTLPPATSLAGILLSALPKDDDQSVLAIFSAAQAVISGRDQLSVNGENLATPDLASEDETAIAFFLYDEGDDMLSSGDPLALFSTFPFLSGMDLFLATNPQETIKLVYNNRTMNVPNWKSDSEGVIVTVFD